MLHKGIIETLGHYLLARIIGMNHIVVVYMRVIAGIKIDRINWRTSSCHHCVQDSMVILQRWSKKIVHRNYLSQNNRYLRISPSKGVDDIANILSSFLNQLPLI